MSKTNLSTSQAQLKELESKRLLLMYQVTRCTRWHGREVSKEPMPAADQR